MFRVVVRRLLIGVAGIAALFGVAWIVVTFRDLQGSTGGGGALDVPPLPEIRAKAAVVEVPDSLLGYSRALRFRTLTPAEAIAIPGFIDVLGEPAIHKPAVHVVATSEGQSFSYLVLRPFGEKRGDVLNGYRLGRWPSERYIMARNYYNPDGFVEVTEENASLALSAHFTLGDFVTHDQRDRWPKYVVLEEKLLDKLELILQELNARGIPTRKVVVLSGFRAPYYNDRGVGEGMARGSRHQFGDAADIIIDDNGDGRMDDLNRNGRSDLGDTAPIAVALNRVEARQKGLEGGLGTYTAMGPSGPFVHIDVRGTSARWESGWWRREAKAK
ncbi:MAG: DUF882 domain-containing protein [Cytophagaceae bacterium]|nr:DUF882 domain-containing protein [Gemmatimonadaceae bacterium]